MFDVEPSGEGKLFVVFDKVASMLEKLITTGKVAEAVVEGVSGVADALKTKYPTAKLATGREGVPDSFIGPVIPKRADSIAGPAEAAPMGKFGAVATAVAAVYRGFMKLANVVMGMPALFERVGNKFDQFVRYLSPATSQRFQYAMEDLYATIGEKLLPVFEPLIGFIEKFADILASINTNGLFSALGKLLSTIGGAILSAFEALAPIINAVIWVFENLVDVLNWVINALKGMGKSIADWTVEKLNWFLKTTGNNFRVGIDWGGNQNTGGRARATRGISVMGLEQAQTRALEAAGRLGQRSAAQQTADNTGNILGLLQHAFPHLHDQLAEAARAAAMAEAERPA